MPTKWRVVRDVTQRSYVLQPARSVMQFLPPIFLQQLPANLRQQNNRVFLYCTTQHNAWFPYSCCSTIELSSFCFILPFHLYRGQWPLPLKQKSILVLLQWNGSYGRLTATEQQFFYMYAMTHKMHKRNIMYGLRMVRTLREYENQSI